MPVHQARVEQACATSHELGSLAQILALRTSAFARQTQVVLGPDSWYDFQHNFV